MSDHPARNIVPSSKKLSLSAVERATPTLGSNEPKVPPLKRQKGLVATSLVVLEGIRDITRCGHAEPAVHQNRRRQLFEKMRREGFCGEVCYWTDPTGRNLIIDGIETYEVASELGLECGIHYKPKRIVKRLGHTILNIEDAKRWRFERNVSTRKRVPTALAVFQAIELFKGEAVELRKQAQANQKAGKKVSEGDRVHVDQYLAEKAGVSRATFKRYRTIYQELRRDPRAANLSKRRLLDSQQLFDLLQAIEREEKAVKNVASDVNHGRQRVVRQARNAKPAPKQPSLQGSDRVYKPSKPSQIICGNSLKLMQKWATLDSSKRPQPDVIFGSPPYWIQAMRRPGHGKGDIVYGDAVQRFLAKQGIKNWDQYQSQFLKPYIEAAFALLPSGGRFIWQVDNTRGHRDGNLVRFWHTDAIRRIGEEAGFLATDEITWIKSQIAGRACGFGNRNRPAIRPKDEKLVVLRKQSNHIEGDFEYNAEFNDRCVSVWRDKESGDLTDAERDLYMDSVWEIGSGHSKDHPAVFSSQLAIGVVKLFCPMGGLILDPWNGSGTTTAAAAINDRRYLGIDIERHYCGIAIEKTNAAVQRRGAVQDAAIQRLENEWLKPASE